MRILLRLVVVVCLLVVMFYHIFLHFDTFFAYHTTQSVNSKYLTKFPKIDVCLKPGYDLEALQNNGYSSFTKFVQGAGELDGKRFYGWDGNSTAGLMDFFEAIYIANLGRVVTNIELIVDGKVIDSKIEQLESHFHYPSGECLVVKIEDLDESSNAELVRLDILFNQVENVTLEVKITDLAREYFYSGVFSSNGKDIARKIDPEGRNFSSTYRVQITEYKEKEKDEEADCKEYNEVKNESFKQCVQLLVEERFTQEVGCVPPWFTKNLDVMCNKTYHEYQWVTMPELIESTMDDTFFQVSFHIFILSMCLCLHARI